MVLQQLIPWRVRHRIHTWMEEYLRVNHHRLYKLLKFGRSNLNTPNYWNEIWSTDSEDRNHTLLFEMILGNIPEGAKVLDVGCGVGLLLKLLKERKSADVTGLDFSSWACEQLQAQGFKAAVSVLPQIPFPDHTFDVAVATEVLEHLDHPEQTVAQMARVVKQGGLILFSVPNDVLHPYEELEHQHSFTVETVQGLLAPVCQSVEIKIGKFSEDGEHEFLLGCGRV